MLQEVKQTRKEKKEMFNKISKSELIEMLINSNEVISALLKSSNEELPVVEQNEEEWIDINDEEIQEMFDPEKTIPTKWFKTEQIETQINVKGSEDPDILNKGRGKLVVMHQCGNDKEALIGQLNTLIDGLNQNFEHFGN